MNHIIIDKASGKELEAINDGIIEYNASRLPVAQQPAFLSINRVIRKPDGSIAAGICSELYYWQCLYVDILWVDEEFRSMGYGSALLDEAEKIAKQHGCKLVHLDTFDFQAKDFYIKQGYTIFGVLDDCPEGHQRYYMKKKL